MYEQLMADFTYKLHEFSKAALKQGIRNLETETTEYGISERRFQAIDLKNKIVAMTIK